MATCQVRECGEPSDAEAVTAYLLPEGSSNVVVPPNLRHPLCRPHADEFIEETDKGRYPIWWPDVLNKWRSGGPIGKLLRDETHRRRWLDVDVRVHERENSIVEVEVGGEVVEMSGKVAQDLWEWLKDQSPDLPTNDFLSRAQELAG